MAQSDLKSGDIVVFLALTFTLSWGLFLLMVVWPERLEALLGDMGVTNPAYVIAVWSPAIIAFLFILRRCGRTGVRRFLGRLSPRDIPLAWWGLALLGLPLIKMAGALLNGVPLSGLVVLSPFPEVLLISLFMLTLGPVEEFGWRGVALPLMHRVMAPVWAGLLVGFVWAIWHLPAFWLGGAPHTAWSLLPFLIGVTAIGLVMAVVYNRTRGNLFLAILIHWQLNIAFWPEAQPWENYLAVALAAALVWTNREVMFTRDNAETRVVPQ